MFAFRKSCAHMVDVGQPPVKRRRLKLSLTKSSDSRVNSDERYVTPRLEEQSQKEHVNKASDDLAHETYFSANFKTVCSTVLSEISPERHVFNDGEINTVQRFMELPNLQQQLYVRLFLRKHQWLRVDKSSYDQIAEDLTPIAGGLVTMEFLSSEDKLVDKKEALNLLQVSELKLLCKDMKMSISLQRCQKSEIIKAFFVHAQQHKPLFGTTSLLDVVFRRVKSLLGSCVRVASGPVETFSKCLLLYSLTTSLTLSWTADGEMNFSEIIYKLLQVKTGQMMFPEYDVYVTEPLFGTSEEFTRFYRASQDLHSLVTAINNKENNKETLTIIKETVEKFNQEISSGGSGHGFMERMIIGWVLAKILTYGVEYLEKKGDYRQATEILELLLSQTKYGISQRGHWLERLTLNLDFHLKEKNKCLEVIQSAMEESGLHPARQLSLIQRAHKLCNVTSSKLKKAVKCKTTDHISRCQFSINDFPYPNITPAPEVMIEARQYHIDNRPLYAIPNYDDTDTYSFVSVEGLAMYHYSREESWPCAVHAEKSTFSLMFTLLMWDIIYCSGIPNVFRTKLQAGPLDLLTDEFYQKRSDLIETRLSWIQHSKNEDLIEAVESCWDKNHGRVCHGADWDILPDVEDAKTLAVCMGGELLSHVCRQFARFYSQSCGGLPDLTLWNPSNSTCKFVEVKGPGDRLSNKQLVWLSRLLSWGCQVEVCRVKAQPQ